MLEPEDNLSNEEGAGGANENTDPNQQGQNAGGAPASGDESPGEAQEQAIDASKVTAEQFLKLLEDDKFKDVVLQSDSVKRTVQSEKDKEIARERRIRADEERKRQAAEEAERRATERRQAIAEGDKDKLFELETSQIDEAETLSKSATKVAQIIEDVVRTNPEFRVLGEDKIDEIYSEVGKEGGNVVDFTIALSKARREQEVAEATKKATESIQDTVKSEIEAALVEAGLKERSEQAAAGEAPSKEVSEQAAPRKNVKSMTYKEASEAYGRGEISTLQFEPFRKQHEEERRF